MTYGLSHAFSVIFIALLSEFGLSRAALSGVFSIYVFVFFTSTLLIGPALDRFSPRIIISAGCLLTGIGLIACGRISSPYQLYFFYGVFVAGGTSLASLITNSMVVARWFLKRRALAMSVVMAGSGVGMFILMPATQLIIEKIGWRGTFFLMAAVHILFLIPLNVIFQRNRPEDMGLSPDGNFSRPNQNGEGLEKEQTEAQRGFWTLSGALRNRSFWMICVALFCNPMAILTITLHQVAFVVERGFEAAYAASILGLAGVVSIGGRIISGIIADRRGKEIAFSLFMGAVGVGVVLLLFLNPQRGWILPVYVFLLGQGLGVGASLFPPMIADLFSGPALGRIMGLIYTFAGLGTAIGSWSVGYLHDLTGNYTWGFIGILFPITIAITSVWGAAPRTARRYT